MILYAYRSINGIHSDETFVSILKPILQENGRYYNAISWVNLLQIPNYYFRLEKGDCIEVTIEKFKEIVQICGHTCYEIDELESFINRTKPTKIAMDLYDTARNRKS